MPSLSTLPTNSSSRSEVSPRTSAGPAGMLLADDTEMYERNQLGIESLARECLVVGRGLNRETVEEQGYTIGSATDETGMHGFWSHCKSLMEPS
jgi:hypothetical protein